MANARRPETPLRDADILAALPPPPRDVHVRDLARSLDLDADGRRILRERLKALADAGRVERLRGNRFGRGSHTGEVTGTLTMTARGFGFLSLDGGGEDLFVSGRNVGPAMHRDRVRARVLEFDGEREATVTAVLEHGTRTFVGTYREARAGAWVNPQDPRLPDNVSVESDGRANARDGDRVAGEFTAWPDDLGGPRCRVLRVFGTEAEGTRETDVIVYDLGLPVEFTTEASALAAAAKPPGRRELARRHDLRERALLTCDPESARDFDDAVHAEPLETGGWRLTVAIADVAHYVREETPLDEEARARGTSVYLPDRVLPMLPHELSSDLCSLKPHTERLAMVVEMEIAPSGDVGRYDIYEAVIRSHARFTYERVARMLGLRDGEDAPSPDPDTAFEDLRPVLEDLLDCTRALRAFRRRRGYLDLDIPEPRILLAPDGSVADVVPAERNEAHKLVEEAMLAANEAVARHFVSQDRPAVFRIHDTPPEAGIARLLAAANAFEAPLHLKGKVTPGRLSQWLKGVGAHPQRRILHQLLLRSMAVAAYNEESGLHFGLGSEAYLHFTSPIRRYPDLLVHRLLKAELHGEPLPDADTLGALADHCSRRERLAVDAERTVQDLYKALFLSRHIGESFDGLVIGVTSIGLFVQLDTHLVEGMLPAAALRDDQYEFDEEVKEFRGRRNGRRFGLGSHLRVRVNSVDTTRRRVELGLVAVLIDPPPMPRPVRGNDRPVRPR
jgi:ribonuclease R